MSNPKHIKRFWIWVGIALFIELAALTLWKRWYWFFPTHAVSEVYTRYAGTDGLNVVFFKDYRINDTTCTDVTLIEAKTDAAWEKLQTDFSIPIIPKEYENLFYTDSNQLSFKLVPKDNPSSPMDSIIPNNDLVVISFPKHYLCFFSIESISQLKAILKDKYDNNVSLNK